MIPSKADVMKAVTKKYRETLTLQEPIKSPDESGGSRTVFSDHEPICFEFRKTSASTGIIAGGAASDMTQEIGVRYRTDVKRGWRAIYNGRRFDIAHTYHYGTETTILVCREVVR